MFVIKYKKIFLIFSAICVLISIFSTLFFGLNLSIDFTGGSILEVYYTENAKPDFNDLKAELDNLSFGSYTLQSIGENGYVVKTRFLSEDERASLVDVSSIGGRYEVAEGRFNSIGPSVGSELKRKAIVAVLIVLISIIIFIAYAFRKVSKPVSSWKYGVVTTLALAHDIVIPVGFFAFMNYEIDILFITAILAVLSYSVNDTIVIFDRVRDNLKNNQELKKKEDFDNIVGTSLNQVFMRSVNTSLTTLFVVLALFFFGGDVTRNFSLVLLIGIVAGTYSSLFLASPLIVAINKADK